jgi:hypothetical protein
MIAVNFLTAPHPRLRHAFLILALLLLWTASAAGEPVRSFHYLGQVDGSAAQLHLQLAGGSASGWLMNEPAGTVTSFTGIFNSGSQSLVLDLGEAGRLSGFLSTGLADDALLFEGNLLTDGSTLPFRFDQAAQFVSSRLAQGRIDTASSYPFFTTVRMQGVNNFLQPDLLADQICFFSEGQYHESVGELFNAWAYDSQTEITYAAPGLFSGLTTVSYYTGGAHPNLRFWSYNLAYLGTNLRPFMLEDLFAAEVDAVALLNPILLDRLAELEAIWVLDGSVSSFTAAELEVFTLSPAGLQIVFPPYAVGPWVQGPFSVTIPFGELGEALRPDGPVRVIHSRSQQ